MNKLAPIFKEFELFIKDISPSFISFHPHFSTSLWEMVLNGGKRFRPKLLLSTVEALSPMLIKNSFYPALSLELTHTYSLIHDDLPCMDDASIRRGQTTLHKKYNEPTAILAGDALNTYSYYILSLSKLSDTIKIKLIKELSFNSTMMVLGQALDIHFQDIRLSSDKLKLVHIQKSAKLIATSLKMAAIISNKDDLASLLFDIGLKIGLMFQINDDIIDASLSKEVAKKNTKADQNKNSYVNLFGIDKSREIRDKYIQSIQNSISLLPINLATNLNLIIKNIKIV